jgi:hypothetical protein
MTKTKNLTKKKLVATIKSVMVARNDATLGLNNDLTTSDITRCIIAMCDS